MSDFEANGRDHAPAPEMPAKPEKPAHPDGEKLVSPSFLGLLVVIFLGATNDNIFRWLVIGYGKQFVTPDNVRHVLMFGSVAFVLPYLLLAAPAGFLADRFSKSRVIVAFKAAEIFIMALGIVGILMGNLWILFAVVFLMGAQSACSGRRVMGPFRRLFRRRRYPQPTGRSG